MNPKNIELVPPMLFGKYEFGMTKLIKRIVKKGWVICEVGAYIGDHTPLFSNLTGAYGKVISIEPQLLHFDLLLKNIALNKLTNVTPIKAAISSKNGTSTMYVPSNHSVDGRIYKVKDGVRNKQKTSTTTIDDLLNQYKSVNLIKMDIQGWEEKALRGARKTIQKKSKLIFNFGVLAKRFKRSWNQSFELLELCQENWF